MNTSVNKLWTYIKIVPEQTLAPYFQNQKEKSDYLHLFTKLWKQALYTDVIYIKSFSIIKNNTKINIIGILCIMFYNYLILIRYYSKLVKLGANISQFQMKSLFLFLKKLNKTYQFVFIICLFLSFGTFLHLCRTTLFLTS